MNDYLIYYINGDHFFVPKKCIHQADLCLFLSKLTLLKELPPAQWRINPYPHEGIH